MASVGGNSQQAVGSGGSEVRRDDSLSAVDENSVHKTDDDARCMFLSCLFCYFLVKVILCVNVL